MGVTDVRTDGQTETVQQLVPCLRVASRGKIVYDLAYTAYRAPPLPTIAPTLIARQHAIGRARYCFFLANPSICPSVCSMMVLCLNEWTYRQTFLTFQYGYYCSFLSHRRHNAEKNPLSGAIKTRDGKKFAIFAIYLGSGTR